MDKQKFRINESDGAKLFLDAIKILPDDSEQQSQEIEKKILRKRKRILFSLIFIILSFVLILSIIMFNLVQDNRKEQLEINSVLNASSLYESRMKDGNAKINYLRDAMNEADSLLNIIDTLIVKYPNQDTLKFTWSNVLLHKYEKYIHYSLKSNMFDRVAELDSNLLNKAKSYNPQLTNLIPILKSIPGFYRYKRLYPEPPILAKLVPQKEVVENLIEKSKEIEEILNTNSSLIEVHFPVMNSWIKFATNYVIPEIYDWQDFWNKFTIAIDPESSKILSETIFAELKKRYPNVEVLKSNSLYDINQIMTFSFGITKNSIYPPHKTLLSEWYPWVDFLKSKFGLEMNIKIYQNYSELYNALNNQEVDFALLDIPSSTVSYFSDAATPIATRVWQNKFYVDNYIFTSQNGIKSASELKNGNVGFFSNDYYELLSYFQKNNIKVNYSDYNFNRFSNLDSMFIAAQNGLVDILTISEEETYYLGRDNLSKFGFVQVGITEKTPLGVIWASKKLPVDFVSKFQGIIIPIPAQTVYNNVNNFSYYPYSDWEIYNQNSMNSYYEGTKQVMLKFNSLMNKLHLLTVKSDSDTLQYQIAKSMVDYLHKEGFMVVNHISENKHINIDDNDQFMKVETKSSMNNNHIYDVKVYKKKNTDTALVYHGNFELSKSNLPPDFRHLVFDMTNYLSFFGKVVAISGNKISLSVSMDSKRFIGSNVKLYKTDSMGRRTVEIGIGKVISSTGLKAVVEINHSLVSKVSLGDIGEFNFE